MTRSLSDWQHSPGASAVHGFLVAGMGLAACFLSNWLGRPVGLPFFGRVSGSVLLDRVQDRRPAFFVRAKRTEAGDGRQTDMAPVLLAATPEGWAARVCQRPLELLSDHAHLERKAANNALELLNRRPPRVGNEWSAELAQIAREETQHLLLVTRILFRRGGALNRVHRNPYAGLLHGHIRFGTGAELLDRLIVSFLIEARSAERFGRLALESEDRELARLYRGLRQSEQGHAAAFLELSTAASDRASVQKRLQEYIEIEAGAIQAQSVGFTLFSGL